MKLPGVFELICIDFFTTGFSPKSPKDMLASFRDESPNRLPEESQ